jgi:DNA polymerase III, alpha subunit
MGLFATTNHANASDDEPYIFSPLTPWNNREKLEKEKEVLGFYVSAHPLEGYRKYMRWFNPLTIGPILKGIQEQPSSQEFQVTICGLLKTKKEIVTKKGDRMAFLQIEDLEHSAEIILFPKTFTQSSQWLDTHHVYLIKGAVDITSTRQLKIKADHCIPIELVLQEWQPIEHAIFTLPDTIDNQLLTNLKQSFVNGSLATSLVFQENSKKLRLALKQKITLDSNLLDSIERLGISAKIDL